eukprot:gnl/MRDRNA2_/MRDRNA2_96492_c0_seq1.p1 gnl/MRDRNA2_/MRDRNA2_96492_c0~~gnl/MRDRNA2_/MRDRNA2_96492_c0_seq1.p1  ORF type:complete len:183 (+),score=38.67 gnl/MRDRNA2_/MRDRNA2_96492_c0_seq1:91-639(+)
MAEFLVAGLAVASTPPVLFAIERLDDALNGKKEEQRTRLHETQDVLPNLLRPPNVVKGNGVRKGDQKFYQSEAKEVPPTRLSVKSASNFNATNKASLASELPSPNNSSRSKATAETKPESPFKILEHDASNPYLLKIPSFHGMEQDTNGAIEEDASSFDSFPSKVSNSNHVENDTMIFWYFR